MVCVCLHYVSVALPGIVWIASLAIPVCIPEIIELVVGSVHVGQAMQLSFGATTLGKAD